MKTEFLIQFPESFGPQVHTLGSTITLSDGRRAKLLETDGGYMLVRFAGGRKQWVVA